MHKRRNLHNLNNDNNNIAVLDIACCNSLHLFLLLITGFCCFCKMFIPVLWNTSKLMKFDGQEVHFTYNYTYIILILIQLDIIIPCDCWKFPDVELENDGKMLKNTVIAIELEFLFHSPSIYCSIKINLIWYIHIFYWLIRFSTVDLSSSSTRFAFHLSETSLTVTLILIT